MPLILTLAGLASGSTLARVFVVIARSHVTRMRHPFNHPRPVRSGRISK